MRSAITPDSVPAYLSSLLVWSAVAKMITAYEMAGNYTVFRFPAPGFLLSSFPPHL